jgi:phospholipid/cholesterol/gamma-HCH transport system substrate-binding protein
MWNRNVTIGIFVVAGVALFILGIFLIGNQHRAFAKHLEFYTEFTNLDGLMKGAKVRVAGLDAGEVSDIGVPNSPTSRFRLKLRIEQRTHGLVRADSLATIATEGVVGDKFLLIHPGSAKAPEAPPYTTLASQEPLDIADLLEKSAGLLNGANGTMQAVADKLNGTLDGATKTVNNANDLVVGLKQGKGTMGMLLHDERTSADIRHAVGNVQQAATSLNHASKQADAMITDFQSRGVGQKADQAMTSAQSAARSLDATSQRLRQTLTRAVAPDEQGVDGGTNIQESLSNLNQATGNMAEDTEALKHEFFFRGFFKRRGYYSLTNLNPDTYRMDKLFASPGNPRAWLEAAEIFRRKQDGSETLSPAGKARIDAAIAQLGDSAVTSPIVVEGYSTAGDPGSRLAASRKRAILVRDYLHSRFQVDLQKIGFVALSAVPPPATGKTPWDGVCILLLRKSSR